MSGIGETLREARLARRQSIDEVAQETRISPRFLAALEAEAFGELPAPVYVRGFLRSYANYLRLDPQPLLDALTETDASLTAPVGFTAPPPSVPGQPRSDPFASRRSDPAVPAPTSAPLPAPAPMDPVTAHQRREGLLVEHKTVYAAGPDSRRLLAWVGGGVAGVALFAFVVFSLMGGGGEDSPALALENESGSPEANTIIAVGTRTAIPTLTGTPGTPAPTATPSGTPGTPTASPTPDEDSPTPQPTDADDEQPTSPPPATATTRPPTATPAPPPQLPFPQPQHQS